MGAVCRPDVKNVEVEYIHRAEASRPGGGRLEQEPRDSNEVDLDHLPLVRRQLSPHSLDETQSPRRGDRAHRLLLHGYSVEPGHVLRTLFPESAKVLKPPNDRGAEIP